MWRKSKETILNQLREKTKRCRDKERGEIGEERDCEIVSGWCSCAGKFEPSQVGYLINWAAQLIIVDTLIQVFN